MSNIIEQKLMDMEKGPIGTSNWIKVTQAHINRFAEASLDYDPMHIDRNWVINNTDFPDTISFGFLTISLLTHFAHEVFNNVFPEMTDRGNGWGLNYGFDKLRLIEPVVVNSQIRAKFTLSSTKRVDCHRVIATLGTEVEIQGQERPALVADWLWMWIFPEREIDRIQSHSEE